MPRKKNWANQGRRHRWWSAPRTDSLPLQRQQLGNGTVEMDIPRHQGQYGHSLMNNNGGTPALWRNAPSSSNNESNGDARRRSTSESASDSIPSCGIPGFLWDPVRRRYFKILPEHQGNNIQGGLTRSGMLRNEIEAQRVDRLAKETAAVGTFSRSRDHIVRSLGHRQVQNQRHLTSQFKRNLCGVFLSAESL